LEDCLYPPALDEHQLLSYLDGEATPGVGAHIEQCPYCRERAQGMAQVQQRLSARLYRLNCPASIDLGEYHLGLLPAERRMAVAQHLLECPHCRQEIAELKGYLVRLAPPAGAGFLEQAREQARVVIARLAGGKGRAPGETTPGLAYAGAAFAGLRGGSQAPLMLEADGILIVLDVQPAPEGRALLTGHVAAELQDAWTGARVELRQGGVQFRATAVDDLGGFQFEGVSPGSAEIQIIPRGGPVVLAPVELAV